MPMPFGGGLNVGLRSSIVNNLAVICKISSLQATIA